MKSFSSSWFLPHCFPLCTLGAHTLLSQKPYAISSWLKWALLTFSPLWRLFPMPLCILTAFNWEALSNLSSKKCRAGNYASCISISLAAVFLQSHAAPTGKALGYICLETYCTRQKSEAGGGWGRQAALICNTRVCYNIYTVSVTHCPALVQQQAAHTVCCQIPYHLLPATTLAPPWFYYTLYKAIFLPTP